MIYAEMEFLIVDKMSKKTPTKHHYLILGFSVFAIIGFLLIHHGYIHDGQYIQVEDFESAIFYLTKSHEGLILTISLVGIGVVIGHYKWIQK